MHRVFTLPSFAVSLYCTVLFFCATALAFPQESSGENIWTLGQKRLLFMRLIFPDDASAPISQSDAVTLMANVNDWYSAKSYGAVSIQSDITPLLLMPQNKSWYTNQPLRRLMEHARAAASQGGYNTNDYDLDIARFNNISGPLWNFSGSSTVRGKGLWLQSSDLGVVVHELGHNFGLQHANVWAAFADSIIGPGTNSEYGNIFDVMGQPPSDPNLYHFNVAWLNQLLWLPGQFIHTVTNSGTWRLHAFDVPALAPGATYALRIRKDSSRHYWLEFRERFSQNPWARNGVIINWSPWENSRFGTQLLDTTPGSPSSSDSMQDAPLVVGRTLSDPVAGIHITPLAVSSAATNRWIDVRVNVGFFTNNLAPALNVVANATNVSPNQQVTFTATASDPDGDPLAFHWEFGDLSLGSNAVEIIMSWPTAGEYVAHCTVSDMKGGRATRSVVVTVGSPNTFRISGRITNDFGAPLSEVRVHNGAAGSAYRGVLTDADGNYFLVNLPSGSHQVRAVKYGFNILPVGWASPIAVGPNAAGRNWAASAYPPLTVTATDPSAAETSGTPDRGTFTITRSGSLQLPLTVRFSLGGSAELWDDFTLSAGVSGFPYSLSLPAGIASTNLTLSPLDDSDYEGPESVTFTLLEDIGYALGSPSSATIFIADSEVVPSPVLRIAAVTTNSYRLQFEGIPDLTYRIEYTEDSALSDWDTLASHTADEFGVFNFLDTIPAGSLRRFYRIVFP